MDLLDKLKALEPAPGSPLSEAEWRKLRAHLQMLGKQDALQHGFTEQYRPFSLPLDYVLTIYEAGRKQQLPREWTQALHQVRVMQTSDYEEYLALQRDYIAVADVFAPYEELCKDATMVLPPVAQSLGPQGQGTGPTGPTGPLPKKIKLTGIKP